MVRKFAVAALLLASQWVAAAPITNSATGLAAPTYTITFDEHALASGSVVTNEFAPEGITFSPNLCYSPQTGFPNINGADVGNFVCTGAPNPTSFVMSLTPGRTDVAFAMVSNGSRWLFEALLGGVVQESFGAIVDTSANNFFGFTGVAMDGIRITGQDFMLIDNVQLGQATGQLPEPVSMSLVALALVGAGAASRRRAR